MPRKYIYVRQIYAKCPFVHARLHFLVKRRQRQTLSSPELDLGSKILNFATNEYLQFDYRSEQRDELALYLIVVSSDNRVVSIGYVPLYLGEQLHEKKEYLKGVAKQNGFIIYSTKDRAFPTQQSSDSAEGMVRDSSAIGNTILKAPNSLTANTLEIFKGHSSLNASFQEQKQCSSSIQCKSIPQVKHQTQSSQLAHQLALRPEMLNSNIKSQGNFKQRSECLQNRSCRQLTHSEMKYRKAKEKLSVHRSKNNSYKDELSQLQLEFKRQQEKIKQLGLVTQP